MRLRTLACLAGVLAFTLPMMANTIYTYTGNPFSGPVSPYTTSDFISGSFTLITPIGANSSFNARFNTSNLVSYTFTDGVQTINDANSQDGFAFISSNIVVGTDATGHIQSWGIGIFNATLGQIDINNNQFLVGDLVYSSAGQRIASSGSPGTWTISSASPVPEPSAFALLGSGMLSIVGLARRRIVS